MSDDNQTQEHPAEPKDVPPPRRGAYTVPVGGFLETETVTATSIEAACQWNALLWRPGPLPF